MEITSLNNKLVVYACHLKEKKYRDAENKFLIEGMHLINMASDIETIFTTNKEYKNDKAEVIYVTRQILEKISVVETPQDIIAICKKKDNKIDFSKRRYLLCDGLQDPGNLGTIIRSALAFNIDAVLLSKGSVDIYNDKVIRGSQGALFKIDVAYCDLSSTIDKLKENGVKIYTSTLQDNSINLKSIKEVDKYCIILGNEGKGVSDISLQKSDFNIKIEHSTAIDSLNVGSAASIMLYYFKMIEKE